MARKTGTIQRDRRRGSYYVQFRWVKFSTGDAPRTVRLYRLVGGAPIGGNRQKAEFLLEGIRGELTSRGIERLPQILSRYLGDRALENAVSGHWLRFLEAKREELADGEIGNDRYRELAAMKDRGYLNPLWDQSIHGLNKKQLKEWVRWVRKRPTRRGGTLKTKSVKNIVTDFAAFVRWLHGEEEIERVPEIPIVKVRNEQRPTVPTENALERYLNAIPEEARGMWLIRAYNGLRPSESRALQVRDYDREKSAITLRQSKTRDLPTLPLDWEVAEWIEKRTDLTQPFAPLFVNPHTGRAWKRTAEVGVHNAACRAIGLYFRPNHVGRHAFGTHAVKRTKDLAAVQKAMRHASPKTTAGYLDREQLDIVEVLRHRGS